MNREKLFHHWHRQYRRLLKRQDLLLCQTPIDGRPEHIHDLRVTLRRLRLMIRVNGPLIDQTAAEQYRGWSRKITNATSRLRDCDVAIEWLATQRIDPAVAKHMAARRQRLWKMASRQLFPPPPGIRASIQKLGAGKRDSQKLERRFLSRFARLHARVVTRIPDFFELDEPERHAFRRTLRRLRYLLEFALTSPQGRLDPFLDVLIRAQAAMGEYQNVLVARQFISKLKSVAPPTPLTRALVREQARWQREIKASLNALTDFSRAMEPLGNH